MDDKITISTGKRITEAKDLPFKNGDAIRLYGHTNVPPHELTPWSTGESTDYQVRCLYPVSTTPWLKFYVTVNEDGTISLQGHTKQGYRIYVTTSADHLTTEHGHGDYGVYCDQPELKWPWTYFYVTLHDDNTLSLQGHTDRAGTEHSYLSTTLEGVDQSSDIPVTYNARAMEDDDSSIWTRFHYEVLPTPGERLHDIIHADDTLHEHYPIFTGYQATYYEYLNKEICQHNSICVPELRDAYLMTGKYALSTVTSAVDSASPPPDLSPTETADWYSVKKQISKELLMLSSLYQFQSNARSSATNISLQFTSCYDVAYDLLSNKGANGIFLLAEAGDI